MKDWVKQLTRIKGYTDQMVEDANAVIFTFGSYRLGVSTVNAVVFLLNDVLKQFSAFLPLRS